MWHKYVSIAVLNYNASYHTSIGCEPSRVFHGHVPYSNLVIKLGIHPQQQPIPTSKMPKMFWIKPRWSTKIFAKIPCRRTSNIKLIATKRPTLQNSKKEILCMPYSQNQIIKRVKFCLRNLGGLAPILLRGCYLTTTIWYAKIAPMKHNSFIVCECLSIHPANTQHTNHAARMETWSGSEPQTRWLVCQSLGVWIRTANFWRREK